MKCGVVVVAFGLADDLENLLNRLVFQPGLFVYLFLHSRIPAVEQVCRRYAVYLNVRLYDYGVNRGLAKSWNEGLIDGYRDGMDVMLIANDDALPEHGDATRIARAALHNPGDYMVSGWGFDAQRNQSGDMLFSLAAINPIALETIGYFDENFFPIYYEDVDYYRRASLAGLERRCFPGTHILHAGSKSLGVTAAHIHEDRFARNQAYFFRKWGGEKGHEQFTTPFNDPALGIRIGAADRGAPYGEYDRTDREAAV